MKSERLILRLINEDDLNSIHYLHSLPETDRFNTLGIPESIDQTRTIIAPWIEDNNKGNIRNYTWGIEIKGSKQFIGLCALKLASEKNQRAEVWYKFDPAHWNQGYAAEAMNEVVRFSFDELELHRVEAGVAVENLASIKLLEKIGMTREGRCRKILPLKSGWSDNFLYAILARDYMALNTGKKNV